MRHEFGADTAASAAAIFDNNGLAQGLADQIAGDAANNVGISSGGKRHDQMDWTFRIGGHSALRQQRKYGRGSNRGNDSTAWNGHRGPPYCFIGRLFIIFAPISL